MDNKELSNEQMNKEIQEEHAQAIKTSEFMKETIKQRPINKQKLMRRLLLTVSMAIIFGLVSCVTFLVLEPVINKRINPDVEEKALPVTFVEETLEEETLPEDMIIEESELQGAMMEQAPLADEQIEQVLNEMELGVDDYLSMSTSINSLIDSASNALVTVVGTTQDKDLFNDDFENEDIASGVVVADNGIELLILTDIEFDNEEQSLNVIFKDNTEYSAELKSKDNNTGLAILSVRKAYLKKDTIDKVTIINMGTTLNRNMNGTPIVAIGRPLGNQQSVCIGNITGYQNKYIFADANYEMLTTDVYGSKNASGFLINLRGQLIGVVEMSQNSQEMQNMISAYAISDIKNIIERMSNGYEIPYIGMYLNEITEDISTEMNMPQGVYISSLDIDTPALNAGIKGGDILVSIDDTTIKSLHDFEKQLLTKEPEQEIKIQIMRQGLDGYEAMEYVITLDHQN